jgi:hypothetical protein
LQQLRQALADGVPPGVALHHVHDNGLAARRSTVASCVPIGPRAARRTVATRRDAPAGRGQDTGSSLELPTDAWQTITWRDGSNTPLTSRFARWRVRPAHDDPRRSEHAAEEWLLIEWPEGEAEPDHCWLSTLPADISLECMVDQAKLRWRIERDYLELKQEVGLGHYEGRGWRGFHHHATLCVAAYGFLISQKETIPPSGPTRTWRGTQPALPVGYRPRGSAAAFAKPHAELNRKHCVSASRELWHMLCLDVLVVGRCVSRRSSELSDAVGDAAAAGGRHCAAAHGTG